MELFEWASCEACLSDQSPTPGNGLSHAVLETMAAVLLVVSVGLPVLEGTHGIFWLGEEFV